MKSDERKFQIPYKWRCDVSITVNIYYTGENGSARKFAEEMIASGTVGAIRKEKG